MIGALIQKMWKPDQIRRAAKMTIERGNSASVTQRRLIVDLTATLNAERQLMAEEQRCSARVAAERDALLEQVNSLSKALRSAHGAERRRTRSSFQLREQMRASNENYAEQIAALDEQSAQQASRARRDHTATRQELERVALSQQQSVADADAARAELAALQAQWAEMEDRVVFFQRECTEKIQNTERLIAAADARATRATAENVVLRGCRKEVADRQRDICRLEAVNEERQAEKEILIKSLRQYEVRMEELRGVNRQLRAELTHAQSQFRDERRRFRLEHIHRVDSMRKSK